MSRINLGTCVHLAHIELSSETFNTATGEFTIFTFNYCWLCGDYVGEYYVSNRRTLRQAGA